MTIIISLPIFQLERIKLSQSCVVSQPGAGGHTPVCHYGQVSLDRATQLTTLAQARNKSSHCLALMTIGMGINYFMLTVVSPFI